MSRHEGVERVEPLNDPGAGTGADASRPAARKLGWRVLRLGSMAIGAAVAIRLVVTADRHRVIALFAGVGPKIVCVLAPLLLGLALESAGWRLVLGTMGWRVRIRSLLALRLGIEPLVRAVPGGAVAAEAAKPFLLLRAQRVPIEIGTASVAVAKSLVVLAQAPYLAMAWVWGRGLLDRASAARGGHDNVTALVAAGLAAGAIGALIAGVAAMSALGRGSVGRTALAWARRIPIRRLRNAIVRREGGFRKVDQAARGFFARGPRAIVPATGLFFAQWLTEAAETFLVARLLGIPIGFGFALAFEALTSLLRALAFFLPGGIGLQDALQVLLVKTAGVSDPVTLGAAFLFTKRMKEVFWIVVGSSFFSPRTARHEGRGSDRAD